MRPLPSFISSLKGTITSLLSLRVQISRDDILEYAQPLQAALDLPSRYASLQSTRCYGYGQLLPDTGDFPGLHVLLDWNPNENWLRNIVVDGSPSHGNMTRSAGGDIFARFLRSRDPAARVLRVSSHYEHGSPLKQDLPHNPQARAEEALLRIVSSLVFNLVDLLPARFQAHEDLSLEHFVELEHRNVDAGISILKALPKLDLGRTNLGLGMKRKKIMIIIDGMDLAFNGAEATKSSCLKLVDALGALRQRNGDAPKFVWTNEKPVPELFPDPYL